MQPRATHIQFLITCRAGAWEPLRLDITGTQSQRGRVAFPCKRSLLAAISAGRTNCKIFSLRALGDASAIRKAANSCLLVSQYIVPCHEGGLKPNVYINVHMKLISYQSRRWHRYTAEARSGSPCSCPASLCRCRFTTHLQASWFWKR